VKGWLAVVLGLGLGILMAQSVVPNHAKADIDLFALVRQLNPQGIETPATKQTVLPVTTQVVPYQDLYVQAAQEHGLDWALLAAQGAVESAFNPNAVSTAGAQGIAQFMPMTWASWGQGGDPFNPNDAIPAQARYVKYLWDYMSKKGRPDYAWAILAYLRGTTGALRLARLDSDSVGYGYVQQIQALAAEYRRGTAGDD